MSDSFRPWIAARQASLSITNSQSLPKLMSIKSVMPSSHLILRRPLFLLPPILPSIESFPMSQLFAWGGQSIGVSASASVLPMNTQDWSPSEWTGWISLLSKGLSRVFSNTTVQKHQFFGAQYYTSNRMAKPKKVDNSKCRRRCRTLTHCWWEYLMVWLFGKSVSTSLQS